MDVLSTISTRTTSQSEQADPRQVKNNAGGFVFEVTPEVRLRRFLTLGSESSYYASAKTLTKENAEVVLDFARNRTVDLVNEVVAISTAGRAPKNDQALFALAAAASLGDVDGRRAALDALPLVARTGTHLFQFVSYAEQFRGWGRGLRRAVGKWYTDKTIENLSYQVLKYRQRNGVSHADLLRLSHDAGYGVDDVRGRLFDWVHVEAQGTNPNSPRFGQVVPLDGLRLVEGFQRARTAQLSKIPGLVREFGLSWEMLPDNALTNAPTWEALLDNGMPQTALIRQLPRLTQLGLLSPLSPRTKSVVDRLTDAARLKKGRVHPINLLVALRTYASGQSARGGNTWTPSRPIVDALDAAFYLAFDAVEPTGLNWLLALDVSDSMRTSAISGMPLTPREASAALALVTAATEPNYDIIGFTAGGRNPVGMRHGGGRVGWGYAGRDSVVSQLSISPRQRLDDVVRSVSNLPFGPTDCALPMLYALHNKLHVDVFAVYTDNETWYGDIHPHQALRLYREQINPRAKLAVLGMTATKFTIADPQDAGQLDLSGFDSAVPTLLADFARGL